MNKSTKTFIGYLCIGLAIAITYLAYNYAFTSAYAGKPASLVIGIGAFFVAVALVLVAALLGVGRRNN